MDTTVYLIDRSRGSPSLKKFIADAFAGALVTDFWAAYHTVTYEHRQFCLAHLSRELERTSAVNLSAAWQAFVRNAIRLFRDALRLRKREDFMPAAYASRIQRLNERLVDFMMIESTHPDARRLAKRLRNYWDELLTFLDHPDAAGERPCGAVVQAGGDLAPGDARQPQRPSRGNARRADEHPPHPAPPRFLGRRYAGGIPANPPSGW
ncbi:MAG: transposase [bacterium]